jgi:thiol:disulfide interchange protein DsbD
VFGGISTSPESSNLKAEHADLHWKDSPGKALSSAQQSNKPVMLDLYADWCAACKKLDRLTFSDNQVSRTLAKSFVPARVNFTEESEETDSLAEKYEVLGLPCVLFLTPEGDEIPGSRVTGFMDASAFLQHINSIGVSRRAMLPQHRY